MTQEEKELLLKDLSARLPYKTRVKYTFAFSGVACINEYSDEGTLSYDKLQDFSLPNVGYENRRVVYILPYLRPMSSMSEEEREKFRVVGGVMSYNPQHNSWAISAFAPEAYDWLNSHHFDYRDLISKGLALPATEGMYS